jgi:hypothetical protein
MIDMIYIWNRLGFSSPDESFKKIVRKKVYALWPQIISSSLKKNRVQFVIKKTPFGKPGNRNSFVSFSDRRFIVTLFDDLSDEELTSHIAKSLTYIEQYLSHRLRKSSPGGKIGWHWKDSKDSKEEFYSTLLPPEDRPWIKEAEKVSEEILKYGKRVKTSLDQKDFLIDSDIYDRLIKDF